MQSIEEINAVVTPETGWVVELGVAPHDQSEFLRLKRVTDSGEKVFVTSLPREIGAGVICSFGGAARHYFNLGRDASNSIEVEDSTSDAPDAAEMAEIEASIARKEEITFCISHHYDIGDQAVYVERKTGDVDAKKAAVFCLFMAEEWFGPQSMVSNLGIAACLCAFYGYRHTARTPIATDLDLYYDRERMCGPGYTELVNDATLHRAGLREFIAPFLEPC